MQTVGMWMLFTEDIYRDAIEHFKDRETVSAAPCPHIAHDQQSGLSVPFCGGGRISWAQGADVLEVGKKRAGLSIPQKFRKQEKPGGGFLRGEPLMNWQVVKRTWWRTAESRENSR